MFDSPADPSSTLDEYLFSGKNSGLHLEPPDGLRFQSVNKHLSSPPTLGAFSQEKVDSKTFALSGDDGLMPLHASLSPQINENEKLGKSSVDALTGEGLSNSTNGIPITPIVEQAVKSAHGYLKGLAADPDFSAKMNLAFGESWNAEVVSNLVQKFESGDFSALPAIEILPSAAINGANGAFASVTNTIYLSKEFVAENAGNPEAVASVLLEEIGHYIDSKVNVSDAAGDEGEIFAALLQGKELSAAELLALKTEDDTATIALDGKAIQIEMDNTLSAARVISVGANTSTYSDFVGTTDTNDYYRFSLSNNSNFSLTLNGLSGDADVQLLDSIGNFIQGSYSGGTTADTISRTLNAGTYHVQVYPMPGVNTNYNLSLSAVPIVQTVNIGLNQTLNGTLSTTDPSNPSRSGTYRDDYALTGVIPGQPVRVNLNSSGFDNYLQVINAATGQVVAENDDANGTNNAEVTFTPVSGVNYLLRATSYLGGGTGSYSISTTSVAPATVSITATDANARETATGQTADPGQFTITRTGSTATALTVNYSVGGTATNGSDYNSLTGSVVIAAGATSAALPINIIDDNLIEGNETAVVTLLSNSAYTLGTANAATVTVADNDPSAVSIGLNQTLNGTLSTTDPSNPSRSGTYRDDYALTGVIPGQPVRVNLNSSGFDNYLQVINAATGQVVAENDDANGTNNAEVTFTPVSGVNYLLRATSFTGGATGSYSITTSSTSITPSTVSITATDANARETATGQTADPGQFIITRTGSTATALTVNYSVGGTATNGSDYSSLTSSVVIPVGATSVSLPINVIDDTQIEGNETAVITLVSSSAYTLGTANSATVAIADNDFSLPTITISATDASTAETLTSQTPNPGQFTITRTGSTATALTVNYTLGGTATNGSDYSSLTNSVVIPVGATSVTLPINVIDDTQIEGNETVVVTLATSSPYFVGSANSSTVTITDNDSAADWFDLNIQDLGLRSAARSRAVDNLLDRNDMIAIFRDARDSSVIDGAELTDLRTLVSNASRFNMPDHVRVLSNKIANSDVANTSSGIGNLFSGSSATRMDSLIGKWFLGSDRPVIPSDLTYRYASGSLFQNGVSYQDIDQGALGDCYFLAGLAATAFRTPSTIGGMFIPNGDDTFTVRFYNNGVADYVTVDRFLPTSSDGNLAYAQIGGRHDNLNNELWVALAEKAYAQINQSGWLGMWRDGTNSYSGIVSGLGVYSMPHITGRSTSSVYNPSGIIDTNAIVNTFNAGQLITIGSKPEGQVASDVAYSHEYVVVGYNFSTQRFTLFNPWGVNAISKPGILELTSSQITASFDYWAYTTGNGQPQLGSTGVLPPPRFLT